MTGPRRLLMQIGSGMRRILVVRLNMWGKKINSLTI